MDKPVVGFVLLTGCKKDTLPPTQPNGSEMAALLKVPNDASDALLSTTAHLRQQLQRHDYSADFVRRHGLPLWGKAIQIVSDTNNFMLYVPLQLPGQSELSGFVAVRCHKGQFGYRLFTKTAVKAGTTGLPRWQPAFWLAQLEADVSGVPVKLAHLWPEALANTKGQKTKGNYFGVINARLIIYVGGCCIPIWYDLDGDPDNGNEYYSHHDCSGCTVNSMDGAGDWTGGLGGGSGGGGGDAGGDAGGGAGGGGSSGGTGTGAGNTPPVDYNYINGLLTLTDAQQGWLLANPLEAKQVELYLRNSVRPEKNVIAAEHVARAAVDTGYMNFVKNHSVTGNPLSVWWEDGTWLDNPNHFALNANFDQQYGKLKTAEKLLVAAYPVHAAVIHSNI